MKFWNIPDSIEELQFDGDKTDLRLHVEDHFNWGAEEEEDYQKAEERLEEFEIKRNGYTVYMWCDISGYDYWMKAQQETNYIQISVAFDKEDFNEELIEELKDAVQEALAYAESIAIDYSHDPGDRGWDY